MTTSNSAPGGDLTLQVLHTLDKQSPILTAEAFPNVSYEDIKAALTRLAGRSMVTYETIEREEALLEPEAEQIAAQGSHEARVFEAVRQAMEGLTIPDLEKAIGDKNVTKVGQGKAFKEKWITKGKDGKLTAVVSSRGLLCEIFDLLTIYPIGRINHRHHSRAAPQDPKRQDCRCEDYHRSEEAQVDPSAEGH